MTSSHIHRPVRAIVIIYVALKDIRYRTSRAINIGIVVPITRVPVSGRCAARGNVLLVRWVRESEEFARQDRDDI